MYLSPLSLWASGPFSVLSGLSVWSNQFFFYHRSVVLESCCIYLSPSQYELVVLALSLCAVWSVCMRQSAIFFYHRSVVLESIHPNLSLPMVLELYQLINDYNLPFWFNSQWFLNCLSDPFGLVWQKIQEPLTAFRITTIWKIWAKILNINLADCCFHHRSVVL